MDFQIKMYRCPNSARDVILIGRGEINLQVVSEDIPEADPALYETLKTYFRLPEGFESRFVDRIRKSIEESIKGGKPKLCQIAGILGLGDRSLQRQLRKNGVNFRKLADEIRFELATSYLKETDNGLTDIALLLGYSEVSAFNRAFKRWTASTPLEYRRKLSRSTAVNAK